MPDAASPFDLAYRRYCESRLLGLRVNRYSWWTHWRELADYLLPRRYKWLITPNQMSRGSPINQHILDSTATLAARNLAAGMFSGMSSPTRPWFKLKIGKLDSAGNNPVSIWLADCERMLSLVFQQSNFYQAVAVWYFDLVVFGTAVMLIYEDHENVINCLNPCAGEYYLDNDGKLRPVVFYREFTYTISQTISEFGIDNVSRTLQQAHENAKTGNGAGLSREIIIAHAIEPNTDGYRFGFPGWEWRECFWEWGGSAAPQQGSATQGFLRKRGYHDNPCVACRWDLVSNDAYGRSPGMDALPDTKQLQLETKRKAQGIDKTNNPPMVADIQLKNQPASLLPGGITYAQGLTATGHPSMVPAYGNWRPDTKSISEDLLEVRDRIKKTLFNDLFQTISQYQTRSNVTAEEINARRAEALLMLGPVLGRVQTEGLTNFIGRTFGISQRAGILPPPPAELQGGENIEIEYISMLALAQAAAASGGIERLLAMAGNLAALEPAVMDKIDTDWAIERYSSLLNNDPRILRSAQATAEIRAQRAQQQAQQQALESAPDMAKSAELLSNIPVGGGQSALTQMTGI